MASNKFLNKLQGKRVLFFGGTSGIGFSVVEGSLEFGADVIISGSNQAKLDVTTQRLKTSYPDLAEGRISTFPCNLGDANTIEADLIALLDKATNNGADKIDHVVYSAGDGLAPQALEDFDMPSFLLRVQVRLIGPFFVTKLLPKYMVESSNSSITFTSGGLAYKPSPGFGITCALLNGLVGLTKSAAVELAPLRVNLVCPGIIDTELVQQFGPAFIEGYAKHTLVRKVGRPEDIAELYLHCMKDGFATGAVFDCDGGAFLSSL